MDQYFAVLYSLEYNAKITSGMSLKLIFSVWTIGFCAAAVSSSQLISAGNESLEYFIQKTKDYLIPSSNVHLDLELIH